MMVKLAIILLGFVVLINPDILENDDGRVENSIFLAYSKVYPSRDKLKLMYPDCTSKGIDCDKIASYFSRIYNLRDSVYHYWNIQYNEPYVVALDTLASYNDLKLLPAVNVILKETKGKKLIIINEAHHRIEHRDFTHSLLEVLKKGGLTHLGLEGLNCCGGISYLKNTFPTINDGQYISEPNYGNLIREAIQLNLKIFGYDCGRKYGNYRDIDAAEFIKSICVDSLNKILLHVGWGHVRKDELFLGGLLANRLKKSCHTDPLTIQQTRYIQNFGPESFNNPLYNYFSKSLDSPGIPVFTASNNLYYDSICDLAIIHPSSFEYPKYREVVYTNETQFHGYLLFIPASENISELPVPVCIYSISEKDKKLNVKIPYMEDCKIFMLNDVVLMDSKLVL